MPKVAKVQSQYDPNLDPPYDDPTVVVEPPPAQDFENRVFSTQVRLESAQQDLQEFVNLQFQEFATALEMLKTKVLELQRAVDVVAVPKVDPFAHKSVYGDIDRATAFQAILVGAMTSQAQQIGLNAKNALNKHVQDPQRSLLNHYAESVLGLTEFVFTKLIERQAK